MSKIKQRFRSQRGIVAMLAVMGAFSALGSIGAAPSQAASYGNAYVSFPTWLGNCPGGGSVTGIYGANSNIWSTPAGGDWGDDLIYPRVAMFLGAPYNQISAQVFCSRPWYQGGGGYWGAAVSAGIRPTRNGQTFWIGPAGQRNN